MFVFSCKIVVCTNKDVLQPYMYTQQLLYLQLPEKRQLLKLNHYQFSLMTKMHNSVEIGELGLLL
jgi:hypothetical protein